MMNISINHLDKTYHGGVHALNDVTLTITSGMFGLLGPNGAGKTTLMLVLAGILRPTNGMLQIGNYNGNTEQGRKAIKRVLGYLPQDFGVYPDLSAREFLDYIGILKGLDDRKARHERVDLSDRPPRPPVPMRRSLRAAPGRREIPIGRRPPGTLPGGPDPRR